jgi:hypothetical protein
MVPVLALLAPFAPATEPPVALPVIVKVPVLPLLAPKAPLDDPPVALPVMVNVPVLLLLAPLAAFAPPPVTFPVTVNVPAPELLAPLAPAAEPAVALPVTVSVPVLVLLAPLAPFAPPPVALPTKVAELPDVPLNITQAVANDPAIELAVSVTPLDNVKLPPAVALLALSFRTSATVALTLTVTAKLLLCSTSLLVKVENTSAAEPPAVVAQMSAALMFAAFLAK